MNIFFLDTEPELAAQHMCDKHVVKMVLESAQLLCTAHHMLPLWELPNKFYKATHKNHPCAIWIRQCCANYNWLTMHALALCDEYTYRYGKTHASRGVIEWCFDNIPDINDGIFEHVPYTRGQYGAWLITPPAQAMPEEYQCDDPVQAYRDYYLNHKRHTISMAWTKRNKPDWWTEQTNNDG